MKRTLLLILSLFLLTAQAEEINSPLVHAEEYPSGFVVNEELLAVDISPVITFQTDEAGVFAVVILASSDEFPTPPSPAPIVEDEIVEPEDQRASFLVTTHSTPHSITYTFTPITPEQGESP